MEDDLAQFRYMLAFFAQQLQKQTDFELVQSYMHLFLKVCAPTTLGYIYPLFFYSASARFRNRVIALAGWGKRCQP